LLLHTVFYIFLTVGTPAGKVVIPIVVIGVLVVLYLLLLLGTAVCPRRLTWLTLGRRMQKDGISEAWNQRPIANAGHRELR
jgi:hypothetical protein